MIFRNHRNTLGFILTLALLILTHSGVVHAGSLQVSWSAVSDSRVAGYKIKYGTTSRTYTTSVNSGLSTTQTLQNLTQGTTYYFVVVAYDSTGVEGTASSEVAGTVLNISNVASGSISDTSATITWQTNKLSDQQIVYGTSTAYGMSTTVDSTLSLSHSQVLSSLLPGTTYHYAVKSRDQGGFVAQSADFTFTTTAARTAAPTISALSPTSGTAGTQVVISGTGFGSSQTGSLVTFSGIQASVVSWGATSITTKVPSGAISGSVVVTVNGVQSNGVTFKIDGKLGPPGRMRVKRY